MHRTYEENGSDLVSSAASSGQVDAADADAANQRRLNALKRRKLLLMLCFEKLMQQISCFFVVVVVVFFF